MPEVQSNRRAKSIAGQALVEFSALDVRSIVSYRLRGLWFGPMPQPPCPILQTRT
jgi:hypothetical protein